MLEDFDLDETVDLSFPVDADLFRADCSCFCAVSAAFLAREESGGWETRVEVYLLREGCAIGRDEPVFFVMVSGLFLYIFLFLWFLKSEEWRKGTKTL